MKHISFSEEAKADIRAIPQHIAMNILSAIHRLAQDYAAAFAGAPARVTSPQGRFSDAAALLDGTVLHTADAHGKHLFLGFRDPAHTDWVHIHLGLYGFFNTYVVGDGAEAPAPVGQVRMRVDGSGEHGDGAGERGGAPGESGAAGPAHVVDLRGPTRCEVLDDDDVAAVRTRLGPDPLDPLTRGAPASDPLATLDRGVRGLRLARMPDDERADVDPEVLAAYDRSLDLLGSLGAEIVPHVPGKLRDMVSTLKKTGCDTICLVPPAHQNKFDMCVELVEAAKKAGVTNRKWVLDPIDGTRSFTVGRAIFGTLIALVEDGWPVLGIIDQPIQRERWVGVAGRPTTLNGVPVRTRTCRELAGSTIATTSPKTTPINTTSKGHSRVLRLAGPASREAIAAAA